jgi:hypothetical protein
MIDHATDDRPTETSMPMPTERSGRQRRDCSRISETREVTIDWR